MNTKVSHFILFNLWILVLVVFAACSANSPSIQNGPTAGNSFTNTPLPPPTATTLPTGASSSPTWNVYVTNVQESPSNRRGWKNITLDVVLESNSPSPFPLYYAKYVSVLDSTGNWRNRTELCCSQAGGPDPEMRVPTGIRFRLGTQRPIEIPQNATLQGFKVEMCGSYNCATQYAVFTADIKTATSGDKFIYPFTNVPDGIPILDKQNIEVTTTGVARITIHPDAKLGPGSFGSTSLTFTVDVENLTGNDVQATQVFPKWLTTSVHDTGHITVSNAFYCTSGDNTNNPWPIPPAFKDTIQCHVTAAYSRDPAFHKAWIGLSKDGRFFLQLIAQK